MPIKQSPSWRRLNQCPKDYFVTDGTCARVCSANQYESEGICKPCSDTCDKCLSQDICNPCPNDQFYFKITTSCLATCPDGYFGDINNKLCVKCSEGCAKCTFP